MLYFKKWVQTKRFEIDNFFHVIETAVKKAVRSFLHSVAVKHLAWVLKIKLLTKFSLVSFGVEILSEFWVLF